ncbi:hypothetical protein MK079_04635 [Candidatus Gracilibacteria bacterium]|nr:hypothetical protein [Candidatus Gracilibacteria bacterium]
MSIEAGALAEQEKKKKESEKAKKEAQKKVVESAKKQQEVREHAKTDAALSHLKDLIEHHDIELDAKTLKSVEKAVSGQELDTEDIQEILEKIDEIENTEDVEQYLPDEMRITKEEYKQALVDDVFRVQVVTKIDSALTLIAQNINPNANLSLNIFSGYLAVLDKKLISLQENHIDIKDNLKEVDVKKGIGTASKNLWERIGEFF